MREEMTQKAITAAGGVNALARALNITSASVAGWSRIPVERCQHVSGITGISLHELRPDIYPAPVTVGDFVDQHTGAQSEPEQAARWGPQKT